MVAPVKRTLEVLNELEQEGVFARYAIGGAMAATFYVEPLLTFDLDVFLLLQPSSTGLVSLSPIVLIEGVPVQFLPAYNSLVEEALEQAKPIDYDSTPARVLRAEHLVAISVQTGRDKDRERVRILRDQGKIEESYLADLLRRHSLEEKWKQWTG